MDLRPVSDWVIGHGLEGSDIPSLLAGASERLAAAGLPLWRTHISFPTLDPVKRSENVIWLRDGETTTEVLGHDEFEVVFQRSPFPEMLRTGRLVRRFHLCAGDSPAGFPIIERSAEQGATDWLIHLVPFGGGTGTMLGAAVSAATDRPGGFTRQEIDGLTSVVPALGLAAQRILVSGVMSAVLSAYIGHDAGQHVLGGQIRRGEGAQVRAALLFADLRGFTAATEREGPAVIGRLGRHLAAMAEPVEAEGGEVLKFLGDGLLAAFPVVNGPGEACAAALRAARQALALNAAVNDAEPATPRLDLDVALHLGEVFYGNIGAGSRLDFTVIGPAVNQASRLERLCDGLGRSLVTSDAFAGCCPEPLASLGHHALRGVSGLREVFGLPET